MGHADVVHFLDILILFSAITQQMGKTQIPLNTVQIIPQPHSASGRPLTYQLQQIMSTNKPHQGMIITSQPTIIATVTQSQPSGQIVTKVLTSSNSQVILDSRSTQKHNLPICWSILL
jgi:hypothetical protein